MESTSPTRDLALVFGGGNALGAYHAGAFEVLQARGLRPDRLVGASMGAVTGAIIAGNASEDRIERLHRFWNEATLQTGLPGTHLLKPRQYYNALHSLLTLAWGRPSIFTHRYPGLWSALPWVPNDVALFDHRPLLATLERLVDFERLNRAEIRLTIACIDVATGEEVFIDNTRQTIRPEHILASAALLPAFPPVEVDGRLLCDAGYTNNLPLDPLFDPEPTRDLLCIALDLFCLRADRPRSLDAVLERANDLIFASAARRAVTGLARTYALRERLDPDGPVATLLHLIYRAGADQLASKSFDFSPSSIRDRWQAGASDMERGLDRLAALPPAPGRFHYACP
ncbi:patatin-like phospholipase family protein [Methylorubrum populi]|uniref:Ferredoxin reductase n=1 Tax=Methylorubrum populi TaxID=223967 RepID=A0A833J272_9HYPH|nr:patatin-like phospholipase family protein [Methylorubrum populi]KAB7782271.1 Ferredoxin reductase [Methylorubrum populi]